MNGLSAHFGIAGSTELWVLLAARTKTRSPVPHGESPYRRISLMTRCGSVPRERARRASLMSWSSACSSNAAAIALVFLTISRASSGETPLCPWVDNHSQLRTRLNTRVVVLAIPCECNQRADLLWPAVRSIEVLVNS